MTFRLFLLACLFAPLLSQARTNSNENALRLKHFWLDIAPLAIQGYDPVSYYSGKALKGSAKFRTAYKGIEYHFANAKNLETFQKNPAGYEPTYGGWCAYAMGARGEKVEPDPKNFKLANGYTQSDSTATTPLRWNQMAELTVSGNGDQFTGAASWLHLYGVGKARKFRIGYGVRFNSYFSKDQEFITAPAKLTSKQEGPQVLFSETFEENLDTLKAGSVNVNSLNAAIYLQYDFNPKFQIGFNIDAIGFSFGKKSSGTIQSSGYGNYAPSAKPYPFNLLLVSENDLGSLNSELYARYFFSPKWAVKAGASFLFSELQTERKDILNNDRYRNKSLTVMVGIAYRLK
jgi:YHS domain-containing protein